MQKAAMQEMCLLYCVTMIKYACGSYRAERPFIKYGQISMPFCSIAPHSVLIILHILHVLDTRQLTGRLFLLKKGIVQVPIMHGLQRDVLYRSCGAIVMKHTLIKLTELIPILHFGTFHYYRPTWPPSQNIPLEARHCGKYIISSLGLISSKKGRMRSNPSP